MSAAFIKRRLSQRVLVGKVVLGGGAPVVVQSMTNTDTADAAATTQQVFELARAGSELVRITVNTPEAAAQVAAIRSRLDSMGCDVPLVGDFHYNGHRLLTEFPDCAQALAKYRINPGNVGRSRKFGKLLAGHPEDDPFTMMVETAIRYDKPVRIGVNWGSLDQKLVVRMMDENSRLAQPKEANEVTRAALIASALENAQRAEQLGLAHNRIVLSCKVSEVQDLIAHRDHVRFVADRAHPVVRDQLDEALPDARPVDHDPGQRPDLVPGLRLVPEIGYEDDTPGGHEEHPARAREARQIPDVGGVRDHQRVQAVAGHAPEERLDPLGAAVSHTSSCLTARRQ